MWTGSFLFNSKQYGYFCFLYVPDAMKRELEQKMREEFAQLSRLKNQDLAPRWSNGWIWQGKPFKRPVYLEVCNKKFLSLHILLKFIMMIPFDEIKNGQGNDNGVKSKL